LDDFYTFMDIFKDDTATATSFLILLGAKVNRDKGINRKMIKRWLDLSTPDKLMPLISKALDFPHPILRSYALHLELKLSQEQTDWILRLTDKELEAFTHDLQILHATAKQYQLQFGKPIQSDISNNG